MFRLLVLLISCFFSNSVLSGSIQQIETEINQQQYSRAAKTGLAILRQQPENLRAQFLTALAFQYNKQPDIAQRYYKEIISSHPELPEPRNNLAMILMNQGEYDQAIDLLITSLKTHPAYSTAWQNLNLLYKGLASEAYRKALSKEKNPRSVMDKIQLSALNQLYDYEIPVPVQNNQPAKTVQLAAATKPVEQPAAKKVNIETDNKAILVKTLQNWASAWSNKDMQRYVAAYTKRYRGGKANHKTWVNYRKSRIIKPGAIQIKLSNFEIKSKSSTRAIIDFHQSFKSPTYQDRIVKRINLIKVNDRWKINREVTIAVL